MRWVFQVPETMWALLARAVSASPRRITERERILSGLLGLTVRDPRPVVVNEAVPTVAGNVFGGGHRHHTRQCLGLGRVDPIHPCPGVRGESDRAVKEAGPGQVVDVGAASQRHGLTA